MSDFPPNELVEQLQHPQPKVRRRAIRRLADSRDPRAIPLLRNAYLDDGDDRVREAAEVALAQFRAMREGVGPRRALGDRARTGLIALLAVLLLGLIAANVAVRVLGRGGDEGATVETPEPALPRAEFEQAISAQIALTRAEVARLRDYNRLYHETGAVACATPEALPAPLDLTERTRETYQGDLTLLADKLGTTLLTLESAQLRWEQMCAIGQANMLDVVTAAKELDQVTLDLDLLERDLAAAIANPAPTFGAPSAPGSDGEAPLAPPDAPPGTPMPTPLPSATPEPTPTPTLTPTPPVPHLDYAEVLRELNRRLAVLGDLQRPYNNGMLDNWQRSEQGESVGTLACALDPWPGPYEWSPAERAYLDQPGSEDPQLEEAVRLINEGLVAAAEARAIYEPSCYNETLASTAAQGIPLATRAVENLTAAQQLVEEIRRRTSQ